ncbi:MAG: helix-turn-helix domain-containing protein [Bacteroidota bacterium]
MPPLSLADDRRLIDATLGDLRPLIRDELAARDAPDLRTSEAHNPDPTALLSQRQFLDAFDVSSATAQRWRDAGMPHLKVGKLLFYRRDAVIAWLEDQHAKAA